MYYMSEIEKALHSGWLLACDAPENVAKGARLFSELSAKYQDIATSKRDACKTAYEQD